jgi:hypothetical protein
MQAAPPVPQAVTSVAPPKLQLCPLQQPLMQVEGEQAALQSPFAQTVLPVHAWQDVPPVPQAALSLPGAQLSPWQQPSGQEAALQMHFPSAQAWLLEQAMHGFPPLPHLAAVGDATQTPLSQQPVGQVAAVQLVEGVSQEPLLHTWTPVQIAQAAPPLPQAASVVPG